MMFVRRIVIVLSISIACVIIVLTLQFEDGSQTRERSLESIKSLPYVDWIADENNIHRQGVAKYMQGNCSEGINVYCSRNQSKAYLMNLSGRIVHVWEKKSPGAENWQHVEMCDNGDLLVIVKDKMLMRMDWNSRIKWVIHMRFHHDMAFAENGDIYALSRKESIKNICGFPLPILDDFLLVISPEGEVKRGISFYDILCENIPAERYLNILAWMNSKPFQSRLSSLPHNGEIFLTNLHPSDILHVNAVAVMDKNVQGFCKKGDLLISVLRLNLIGIIDLDSNKLKWKWGSMDLDGPHDPSLLTSGNVLIFDNGFDRGYSRIVELEPKCKEIVWEYRASPPGDFFSKTRGSCQRLPNGNTLIAESDKGRVFEITASGSIVWEFYNPDIQEDKKKRAPIYRMKRIAERNDYANARNSADGDSKK